MIRLVHFQKGNENGLGILILNKQVKMFRSGLSCKFRSPGQPYLEQMITL